MCSSVADSAGSVRGPRRMRHSARRFSTRPSSRFFIGQHVVIDGGPLIGLPGVVIENRTEHRLVVSVALLQHSVMIEIDVSWLRPVGIFDAETFRHA